MMAYLRRQCVERHRWLSEQDFKEGMALCHLIPGATMMQMATYVGYRLRGMPGALTAALAFVLPAFLLMVGLSAAYFAFGELALVKALFRGLGAVVVAIILNACVSLGRTTLSGWQGPFVAALAFGALLLKVNLLVVLLGSALLGLALWPKDASVGPRKGAAR
jgi:chromate transporter